MIRSLLYVPASSERFLAKAHERGADAIILDLEDAVAPQEKERARAALKDAVRAVGRNGASVFVRINAVSTGLAFDDADAACRAGAFGLFVAKVQAPVELKQLDELLDVTEREVARTRPMALVPMLEDPGAVLDARVIAAASRRTFALVSGSEDMATAMGAEPTPEVLRLPKLLVHLAAKGPDLCRSECCVRSPISRTPTRSRRRRARRARSALTAPVAFIRAWSRSSMPHSVRRRRKSIALGA
jgi:citrate lyase subunit beta/citryl-CoA lyase